jgi:hypothetical protein
MDLGHEWGRASAVTGVRVGICVGDGVCTSWVCKLGWSR